VAELLWDALLLTCVLSGQEVPSTHGFHHPAATASMQRIVLVLQMDDPRNSWETYDYGMGVRWIQEWWHVLEYPRLEELNRLPSKETTRKMLNIYYAYAGYTPTDCLTLERCRHVWEGLWHAHGGDYLRPWWERRMYLDAVREVLGAPAFYRGEVIPPVPLEWIPIVR
jgi:hypothetical protein